MTRSRQNSIDLPRLRKEPSSRPSSIHKYKVERDLPARLASCFRFRMGGNWAFNDSSLKAEVISDLASLMGPSTGDTPCGASSRPERGGFGHRMDNCDRLAMGSGRVGLDTNLI